MQKMSRSEVLRHLGGSVAQINREMVAFAKTARRLSLRHRNLVDRYPSRWIALYGGRVAADAKTLPALVRQLKRKRIPSQKAVVRFMTRDEATLIL